MSKLLKKAFEAVAQLPEKEQEALAVAILAEIASDAEWDERFTNSTQTLEKLADEALSEYRKGRSEPLDPDAL